MDTDYSFMSTRSCRPSLIACACLAEALQQLQSVKYPDCVEIMEYETKIDKVTNYVCVQVCFVCICMHVFVFD